MSGSPAMAALPPPPQQLRSPHLNSSSNGTTSSFPPISSSSYLSHSTGASASPHTPAHLATLLADAYAELDVLRRDLSQLKKRAEKAERLANALGVVRGSASASSSSAARPGPGPGPSSSSADPNVSSTASSSKNPNPNTTADDRDRAAPSSPNQHQQDDLAALLLSYESRATLAEVARDEADAKLAYFVDNWTQLDRYMTEVDAASLDARRGFGRVVEGALTTTTTTAAATANGSVPPPGHSWIPGGAREREGRTSRGRALAPGPLATLASFALPPLPGSVGSPGVRRPRTPSVDAYGVPAGKRRRGESDPSQSNAVYASRSNHSSSAHHQPSPAPGTSARMILPPSGDPHQPLLFGATGHPGQRSHHRPPSHLTPHPSLKRAHSRSSSDSSSGSLSVDEMLLAATTGDASPVLNGGGSAGIHPGQHQQHQLHAPQQHQQRPPSSARRPNPSPGPGPGSSAVYSPPHPHAPPPDFSNSPNLAVHGQARPTGHRAYSNTNGGSTELPPPAERGKAGFTGSVGGAGSNAGGGQAQFQTHVFAPVVTGAPVKRSKYSATLTPTSSSSASLQNPQNPQAQNPDQASSPPVVVYPPSNAAGQRICRQCGMAGRYKDGKCVEKWGPGPMGPGTVCDRCRKKMKRVERRGTLEAQAQQNAHAHAQRGVQRSDTMPAHLHSHSSSSSAHVASSSSHITASSLAASPQSQSINHSSSRHIPTSTPMRPSPGPAIAAFREPNHDQDQEHDQKPTDDDIPMSNLRGGGGGRTIHSSEHGYSAKKISSTAAGLGVGRPSSSSAAASASAFLHNAGPSAKRVSRSPGDTGSVMDVDADGDEEIGDDEIVEIVYGDGPEHSEADAGARVAPGRGAVDGDGDGDMEDGEGEERGGGDAELELLEAVDAAEANSVSSDGLD
ncbi:hypothetical protein DXG03_008797 [Asterophora parasitica]|uniref:Uncharacterized protein n=1 Tax=Asterophora parasitica TaxID=117018 RepID=A0A9P7G5I6_9AGAR|nr:hypothetical protein DXG03_008797 [Asterophora parasitica]